jgi:hypothetical protein
VSTIIQLSRQGSVALIDEEDLSVLSGFRWHLSAAGYAVRNLPGRGKGSVLMHRQILNAPTGFEVDHVNGNRVDNRRSNLRLASHAENSRNQGRRSTNKSGSKGVHWDSSRRRWAVELKKDRRKIYVGRYSSIEAATAAYDVAVVKYHGSFARPNAMRFDR